MDFTVSLLKIFGIKFFSQSRKNVNEYYVGEMRRIIYTIYFTKRNGILATARQVEDTVDIFWPLEKLKKIMYS
jgi:hypothetical protein